MKINSFKIPMYVYSFESIHECPVTLVPHINDVSREEEGDSGDGVSTDLILFGCRPVHKLLVHLFLFFLLTPTSSQ